MTTKLMKTWSRQAVTNSLRTRIRRWMFVWVLATLCIALPPSAFAEHAMDVGSDGRTRVLWTRTDGRISVWVLDAALNQVLDRQYGPFWGFIPQAIGAGILGETRVLWKGTDGRISVWVLDAALNVVRDRQYGGMIGWTPQTISVGNDNRTRVLWKNTDGRISVWVLDTNLNFLFAREHGPHSGWETRSMAELTPPATAAQ
jgi:hypothetical protein